MDNRKRNTQPDRAANLSISENTNEKLLDHARIPHNFRDATLVDDSPYDRYAKNLEKNLRDKQGIGMLLLGGNGVGKTTIAAAILRTALRFTPRALFITSNQLIRGVIEHERFDDDMTLEQALQNRDVLVIDDLGQEYRGSGSGFAEQVIGNVLRYRVQHDLITIITTNWSKEELKTVYGESFYSLLAEGCVPLKVVGKDLRRDPIMIDRKRKILE